MPGRDIVVIGASAGGVEVLKDLVRGLPADILYLIRNSYGQVRRCHCAQSLRG